MYVFAVGLCSAWLSVTNIYFAWIIALRLLFQYVGGLLSLWLSNITLSFVISFCISFQGGLEIPVISLTVLVVVKAMVSVMELTEIYQNVTVKMWVLCIKQIYSFRICKRCHKDKQRVWGRIKNTSQKKNMVQSSIYSGADTLFCYMSISINSSFNYTIFVYVLI